MKRVFLYAYDKVNFGDDLFVRMITSRYPDTKFYLWSDKINKQNFSDIKNLIVLDKDSRILQAMSLFWPSISVRYRVLKEKKSDAIVYIGGSIFIEYPYWERYVEWWQEKAKTNKMFVLGANWGPYKTEEYRKKMGEVFSNMNDVCFRDNYSYEQFKGIPTVRFAPDILLDYPIPIQNIKKKQIFVSLIYCGGDAHSTLALYKESYTNNIVSILRKYIEDGCNIVLASFCKHEGDECAILEILQQLNALTLSNRIQILKYNGTNVKEVIQTIAESDYVIATRLHSIILALAARRPVLPIIYSDKTMHMLRSIGFSGRVFDLRLSKALQYEQSKENWIHHSAVPIKLLREKSNEHFVGLDLFLKKMEKPYEKH